MMRVAFVYPGNGRRDALCNWIDALARQCGNAVQVARHRSVSEIVTADVVFLLTQADVYPRFAIDDDMATLRRRGIPCAVIHNNDCNVPTPGDYPSFAWTESAMRNLAEYKPTLVRQPIFIPFVPVCTLPVHVGTFGIIEPKKHIVECALWARSRGYPFTAFGPEEAAAPYQDYLQEVKETGAEVVLYPWTERVEELAPLFREISHFLFVLPVSKGGTGGSPTSPRYATMFSRPILVIDDEDTFQQDNFHVYSNVEAIPFELPNSLPLTSWTPQAYLSKLVEVALCRT